MISIRQKKALTSLGVLFLLFLLFLPAGRVSYAQNSPGTDSSKEIIVVFKSRPTISLLAAVSDTTTQNLEIKNGITASNAMVFSVTAGDVKNAMSDLSKNPNVAAVFPNYKLHLLAIPNDPEAMATPMPNLPRDQWYLFNLNLAGTGQSAWDITTGSPSVVVAVVDTGVQSDHADFKNSDNSSKFSSLVDCTGSACQEVNSLTDNNAGGHGTATAGLVGAATNNGNGISGTGYNTKIMAIRIVDSTGSTTQDKLINALTWAADHGAKVINLSVGVVADSLTPDAIKQYDDAVAYAWNKGAVVVAAAGNCVGNTQGNPDCAIYQSGSQSIIIGYSNNSKLYPAASPNVISVAALTVNNTLASYSEHNDSSNSNIGNWVDVAAPGGDGACTSATKTCILSTIPTNQLYWQEGTSFASPQVAGVAALLFAVNPNLTNTQVKSIIENTANGAIASGSTNHGLINALAAVQQAGTTAVVSPTPTPLGGNPSATPTPVCAQPTPPVCTNGTLVQITPPDTGVCFKVTCVITTPTITPTSGPTATPTVTPYPTTAPKLPRSFPASMPSGPYCPQTILNGGTSDVGTGRFFSFNNLLAKPVYAQYAGGTCTVSLSTASISLGTPVTVSYSGTSSTSKQVSLWINKQPNTISGGNQITPLNTSLPMTEMRVVPGSFTDWPFTKDFYQYYTLGCTTSNNQPCSGTFTINNIPTGSYNVICGLGIMPYSCSGQPFCSYYGGPVPPTSGCANWSACGVNDHVTLNVLSVPSSTLIPNPTATPAVGATATPVIGVTATPVASTYCSMKSQGDANCDGKVDLSDYNLWTQQFDTMVPAQPTNQNSNFMCVEGNTQTYFADLVDFEIWRRNTSSGLVVPGPTSNPLAPTANPNTQVNLALIPAQATFPLNGTQTFTLQASFPGGSVAQKLDGFTTEVNFPKDLLMMSAGQYIDTSTSGFKKILRVDGPTQANGSGKIIISLLADVPGGGPATDKTITIATIKFQAKALATNQSISIGKTQIVNNQSQALTVSTAGTTFTVQ